MNLLSFARFFSLPLDPALLLRIRREALALRLPEVPALALAAAEAKGVRLSAGALERYAAALDPRRAGAAKKAGDGPAEPPDYGVMLRKAADFLRNPGEVPEGGDGLLSILNRLPGRGGSRWAVYPFRFETETTEIAVSLRLWFLRNGPPEAYAERLERMAVDIFVPAGEGGRSWLFLTEKPGTAAAHTRIIPDPLPREPEALEGEARRALGASAGVITVEAAPAFADARGSPLFTVDEAV
ncbi:MAG: hypothetical protein LBQ35_02495 [Spirochaetaceae bacterium]|jgi:hypothetical protein|nr:hypothetical protein [Spirochaetaceae bacterium]